jgi:hypothetical protein
MDAEQELQRAYKELDKGESHVPYWGHKATVLALMLVLDELRALRQDIRSQNK